MLISFFDYFRIIFLLEFGVHTWSKYFGIIFARTFDVAEDISDGLRITQLPAAIAPIRGTTHSWKG